MPVLVTLAILSSAVFEVTPTDPFSQSAPGWILCDNPDEANKKCDSLLSVDIEGPGRYLGQVQMWVPGLESHVLYDWPIAMAKNESCMPMRVEEYRNIRFLLRGREVPASAAPAEMAKFRSIFAPLGPKVIGCTAFFERSGHIQVVTELRKQLANGSTSVLYQKVGKLRWVHKDDGWTVRS